MGRQLLFGVALLCLSAWIATPSGQGPGPPRPGAVDDEIIVQFRLGISQARRDAALAAVGGGRIKHFEAIDLDHVRLPRGRRASEAIAALLAGGDVRSAQPNFIRHTTAGPPNDYFWTNDVAWGFYGLKKIQADLVWSTYDNTGSSSIVIADIDTGVKFTHPDLAANMWINPGEIAGNGIDDDVNGYVDDVHGIDTINHDSNPMDDHGHGTHTAGTFGAVGNNGPDAATGTATVGVNWTVKILACKFLDAAGNGTDAGAIECFNYITLMKNRGVNIRVSSNSWGGYRDTSAPFPQALKDSIDAAGNAGILNVFAAGNGDEVGNPVNIDTTPHDPASFDSPSIVSVAASDSADNPGSFSNFGTTSVDLAAPGVSILSTWKGNNNGCVGGNNCAYVYLNGTSMATPHVAGAAALISAQSPAVPVAGLKSLLLGNVDVVGAWPGLVATGGRLNVFNAANALAANTPPSVSITSPSGGATFTAPASIPISADASDGTGTITKVEFFANAALVGTDTSSPFSITALGVPEGNYSLTAKATDNLGAETTSAPVMITVFSGSTPSASLSPSSLAFAKQLVGTTSAAAKSATITNNGPGALAFASFNGAPPASAFTVGGDFQAQTDCPLTPAGLAPAAACTFTFHFSPVAAGPRAADLSIATNASTSPHSIALSGTAFVVDAATVAQTVIAGGTRLQELQNADGGWYFGAGDDGCYNEAPGVSCPNTVGVTALALLSAYDRSGNEATLAAAEAAGDRLVALYNAAPASRPFSQDLEFLIALSAASANPLYANTAALWFQSVLAAFPNAAARADISFTLRGEQHFRSLAVWDLASLIRSAKSVGQVDYALALATRVRDREADWMDVNPAHRWDQCEVAAGCAPGDNPRAFDYTLLGMGSFLWAIHDLPGFDTQIAQYRSHLLAQQDAAGTWDAGDLQITSYVMLGLAAVGGAGTDAAIQSAAAFSIANQLPSNGWPYFAYGEFTVVDSEVIRAVDKLFSTPSGSSVQVAPAQLSTVTFGTVSAPGATTVVALDNTGGTRVPFAYSLVGGLSYEVSTSAEVDGGITMCLAVPWAATSGVFANIRILHAEGAFADRTIVSGPHAPDLTSKRVCALVSSVGAFAVAVFDPDAVDTTAPDITVALSRSVLTPPNNRLVTITATIAVSDNADPSPAVTLVSITSSDADKGNAKRADIQDAQIGADDRSFALRAAKGARGRDRVYTIVYRATDSSGNSRDVTANVVVPRRR